MSLATMFLDDLGKAFVFKRFRPNLREYFLKAGIVEVPYRFFGALFWLSFMISIVLYIFWGYAFIVKINAELFGIFLLTFSWWIVVMGAIICAVILGVYFYLDIVIYNRTQEMEDVLQDFLRLVAQNLKGGMPFERALWSAIKPEFGVLANEVQLAAKKVMTGHDVDQALSEFTMKYDSPTLKRSFTLVVEALESGGEIAETIEHIAEDLQETTELKREMAATNLTYVMFVIFIVVVIAPGLFTLSYQFLRMLESFSSKLSASSGSTPVGLPFTIGKPSISLDDYNEFARNALLIISTMSAMIVSIIRNGDIKAGIKYIPFMCAFSLMFYVMFMILAGSVFGAILK